MRRILTQNRICAITEHLLTLANIPLRFWNVALKKITHQETGEKFQPLLHSIHDVVNAGNGYLLRGAFQTGKTSMAVLFGKEVIRRGGIVTFIPAHAYMGIEINNKRVSGAEDTISERVQRSNLLIIDDLGSEVKGKSGVSMSMFEGLLRTAYNNKTTVIATTNLNTDEIKKQYSPAVCSLITCLLTPMKITNEQWS